jgi:hypothetical protein
MMKNLEFTVAGFKGSQKKPCTLELAIIVFVVE